MGILHLVMRAQGGDERAKTEKWPSSCTCRTRRPRPSSSVPPIAQTVLGHQVRNDIHARQWVTPPPEADFAWGVLIVL